MSSLSCLYKIYYSFLYLNKISVSTEKDKGTDFCLKHLKISPVGYLQKKYFKTVIFVNSDR